MGAPDAPPQETPEQAAARAAQTAPTPAAAQAPAAAAATQAAAAQHPGLSDADAEKIGKAAAKAQIAELEARGVFEQEPPAPPPASSAPAPETPGEQAPQPGDEQTPQKKSLAARFMGIKD